MEEKIHQDMTPLQDLMEKAAGIEGVEVVPGDGFVMMSPVSLEHVRTFRYLTGVFDDQLDDGQGLEAVGEIEVQHPEWDTGKSPDVVLWSPRRIRSAARISSSSRAGSPHRRASRTTTA
ncbi:Uma2 family endonuclease [Streptomyces sp. N2-109]|uniref:Uma2 family endonuclease n=1 Tax=Streptomyces gossypii TaxID=2883101 RepID=A0ABT2JUA8_9ACTN|nr:Uma2 family endonuclease [Streptomyces gossypii]MCT2591273.1 Uma2 family endonuclease [Streptomyces gossypii]